MAAGISTRNRATMEKLYLLLKVESPCRATGYPLRTPRLEGTVLDAHTLANQLRSSQIDTWAFYASVDGLSLGTIKSWHISLLKSAWSITLDVLYKLSQNQHNYWVL